MLMDEKSVVLSENPTPDELHQAVALMFHRDWITGFDYQKATLKNYTAKELDKSIRKNSYFILYMYYVTLLAHSLNEYKFNDLDKKITKELCLWDEKGGLCIYLSVLLYTLLTEEKVVTKDAITFVQGYYEFDLREDFPPIIPFSKVQRGVHAWVEIGGAVIDLSSFQNARFFDFKGNDFITKGDIPEGMKMIGFPETRRTVNKYVRFFAKQQEMKSQDWIAYHQNEARNVFLKLEG